jgi:hypothetical protein
LVGNYFQHSLDAENKVRSSVVISSPTETRNDKDTYEAKDYRELTSLSSHAVGGKILEFMS